MNSPTPVIGDWYHGGDGALFEVVAIDRDDGTIEVQHFDGTLEEFDLDVWREQGFAEADAPEDWTGSVDIEPEDYDTQNDSAPPATLWTGPLEFLDRTETSGYSEWPQLPDEQFG